MLCFSLCGCQSLPEGPSQAKGTVSDGELINGRKLAWSGVNHRYFSWFSYGVLNRAWVHDQVEEIVVEAYQFMAQKYPEKKFLLMECSRKHGGKMLPHRTHQNGTSIDFATPLIRKGLASHRHHWLGLLHYALQFDSTGKLKGRKKVQIDYEAMGQHILALERAARKRGMFIKKVIFKIDLKDDFFKSKAGKQVRKKKIYFAQKLSKTIDNLHDDHYHVDFGFLKKS